MNKKNQPLVSNVQLIDKDAQLLSEWIKVDADYQLWNMQINSMMYSNVTNIQPTKDDKERTKEGL